MHLMQFGTCLLSQHYHSPFCDCLADLNYTHYQIGIDSENYINIIAEGKDYEGLSINLIITKNNEKLTLYPGPNLCIAQI